MALAVIGAVASDALSNAAGRACGKRARRRLRRTRAEHGSGRLGRGLRGGWPVLPGSARLRLPVFLAASTVGALAWVAVWVAGGAAVGALWEQSKLATIAAALAIAGAAVARWVLCRRSPRSTIAAA